ncbi:magnesium transporter [Devosia lucknowensis]|uniref:Magnesium transport protein CorA n=1 Tax=Devosia lucknowensis TaxID=1096929 RepID=A0A1Y6EXU7_9HYPH|nr:magnesium/cobalt transporter CorA [Devosia lucknowensis]SMQ66081.1 magnesium transporter [Devosia lucknowensis]
MLKAFTCTNDLLTEAAFAGDATGLVWIDLENPTREEDQLVEQALGIVIPSQADMAEIELSSRLYHEDGAEFLTLTALANLDHDDAIKMPVTFILKGTTLVTVRWCDPRPFAAYRTRAARQKDMPSRTGEHVMLGLLEALIDRMADALERLGTDVDHISREIFRNKARNVSKKTRDLQAVIEKIGNKAELLNLIQESLVSIGRLTAYHAAMDDAPRKTVAARENRNLLKVIQRDALSLGDHARALNGRASFLLDATLGLINLEQNQIIKIFSVAAVVFLPPTLVASIYGMNFDIMPELHWDFGYPFAIVLMVVFAVLPYIFFKRKGWL